MFTGGAMEERLYDVNASDPESQLIDRSEMSEEDVAQIGDLMTALARMRKAEERLADASTKYMKLNRTDMRALHYLIVAKHQGSTVTPSAIAAHLNISSASTTKLLDRLERGGHIERSLHPHDRRALVISITPETHAAAMRTVGQQQAKRFHAAARLSREERDIVVRFLEDMTREIDLTDDESWATDHAGQD